VNIAVIYVLYLEAQTLAKKQSTFQVFFVMKITANENDINDILQTFR